VSVVSPQQSNPGDEITAAAINNPVNQIAAVVNGNIDANNIADNAVSTAKIADTAVTPAKLQAGTSGSWVWQTWTPTWTGTTIGNATVAAKYIQIGKAVHFKIAVTIGSSTTIAGAGVDTTFTLPVAAVATGYLANVSILGRAGALHTGTVQFGPVVYSSTSVGLIVAEKIVSSTVVAAGWNVTNVGVSTGDTWGITGVYEAA
jgi:hypothetical protein